MSLSTLDEPLSILILFPPWFFDLVFALGGGGKITPFLLLYFWRENVKNLKLGTNTKYLV